jgi:translation initiation factor IF-3
LIDALSLARELELDLVEVAPLATPPVCRIMDYGKFRYEESQKAKESRKKSVSTSIKEMKYRPKIGTGDFDTKTRKVAEFLTEGHKVKITIMFRGREMQHPELGMKILTHLAEEVVAVGKIEAAPKVDGRNMIMVLAPDRKKQQPKPPSASSAPTSSAPTEPIPSATPAEPVDASVEPSATPAPSVSESAPVAPAAVAAEPDPTPVDPTPSA